MYKDDIKKAFSVICPQNGVAEIRILNTSRGTYSGYFNDDEKLIKAVEPFVGEKTFITH